MRKIIVAVMSTISGLVLLFSYHTSTNSQATEATEPATDNGTEQSAPSTPNAAEASGSAPDASESTAAPEPASATESSSAASGSSGTYTGDAVETHWGTVQVQITVVDGKITKAAAIEYPTENRKDQQINAYAIPKLNAEAVAAQSARIDAISGATVTSDGYIESLQSALDAAHLG